MHRKDVNEHSPMRVFERSIHGGLGKGNVGLVAAAAGVGKKALLVQIALDDLMRDRKVLHISHQHPVDRERSTYDAIFHDLAETTRLEEPDLVRTMVERNRLIYSHLGRAKAGVDPVTQIRDTVRFAREVAQFSPDVIVIGGFEFMHAEVADVRDLAALAGELNVELWVAARCDAPAPAPGKLPEPMERFRDLVAVVVYLEPAGQHVRLRLLKDHDATPPSPDLHLRLDPHTMGVIDEDVPPRVVVRKVPARFRLLSGGSRGAEEEFGASAERWGVQEVNYSFDGHRLLARKRGVVVLDEVELRKGDFSLRYVSKRLDRVLSDIPLVRRVLGTIWHQINQARQVFVVGTIQDDGHVKGGTGWGAELSRLWKKPLWVYDQNRKGWFSWNGKSWELCAPPTITTESFAGIGTQHLTDEGRKAIQELFERSFSG